MASSDAIFLHDVKFLCSSVVAGSCEVSDAKSMTIGDDFSADSISVRPFQSYLQHSGESNRMSV